MAKPGRTLKVLVAGSYHYEDGARRNIVQVIGRGGPLMQHKKFNPFSVDINGTRYTEDIDSGDACITLAAHQSCIFTSMICKDLLAPGVVELLAKVGVDVPTLEASCSQVFRSEIDPPLSLIFDTSARRQGAPWVESWSENT